jgi:hypothetical protein
MYMLSLLLCCGTYIFLVVDIALCKCFALFVMLCLRRMLSLLAALAESRGQGFSWVSVISESSGKFEGLVRDVLEGKHGGFSAERLAETKDPLGRKAIQVATPKYRSLLAEYIYFAHRYEILPGPAVHESATCKVVLAVDHGVSGEAEPATKKVALKLMAQKDQFLREVTCPAEYAVIV